METLFVRLKPYHPRRGHVLRRYTYRGIKFQEERGWYRVPKEIGTYLRTVRQIPGDEHAPLAFDVCAEAEAKKLDTEEQEAATARKQAADALQVSMPRDGAGVVTSADVPSAPAPAHAEDKRAGSNNGNNGNQRHGGRGKGR